MKQSTKEVKKGNKAPEEKKTNKKPLVEKQAKNIKEVKVDPIKELENVNVHGIDPVVEPPPLPTESSEIPVSEDGLILNEPLIQEDKFNLTHKIENIAPEIGTTHTKVDLDGGLCRVTYSDGSSGLMSLENYQNLPSIIPVPPKPIFKPKTKEEMDEEAHWMMLGQIDHYIKNIKKN